MAQLGREKKSTKQESNSEQVKTGLQDSSFSEQSIDNRREGTRHRIAFTFIIGYFIIIAGVLFIATLRGFEISGYKDLLITASGVLSGPLGFILGFYYKSTQELK